MLTLGKVNLRITVLNIHYVLFFLILCFEGRRFGGGTGKGCSLHAVCCSSIWLAIVHLLKPIHWTLQTLWRLVRCKQQYQSWLLNIKSQNINVFHTLCVSCRSPGTDYDIVGGDHLGCHFNSILQTTGLQYRDFIYVSFHNQVWISLVISVCCL